MTTTEITFTAVEMFTVPAADFMADETIWKDERARSVELPAVLHMEAGRDHWRQPKKVGKKYDYNVLRQLDRSRISSMVADTPDVKLARETGNPYRRPGKETTYNTPEQYKVYQPVAYHVWAALQKAEKPMTALEIAKAIEPKCKEQKGLKYYADTVMDALRDLSLVGLAQRDSMKNFKNKTQFRAVDPASVKLANEQ